MAYIRDLERELCEMLKDLPDDKIEDVIKFMKDKVYQSYRNGLNGKGREKDSSHPFRRTYSRS